MNKFLLGALIVIAGVIGVCIYIGSTPTGNTIESRESLLDASVLQGKEWSIVKEIEIKDYIISAAYSINDKSTIAVFKPTSNGGYEFSSSTCRDHDEIIIGEAIINENWYDLVWFNGAQTEYAEMIYTIDGQKKDPLRYVTTDMNIIYNKNSTKAYTLNVLYYDSNGNKYE